jgi:hypothetical protein
MTADSRSSLLIVGGTKAGKTHYGGQLLRRLEAKKHRLRIVGAPSDRTPFQGVLDQLALGRSAPHTPTSFYKESIWYVRSEEQTFESQLVWPDYGGEQIEDIVTKRQVSEPWLQRIRESNGWLFFVRLSTITPPEDVLGRPRVRDRMQSAPEEASSQTGGTFADHERAGSAAVRDQPDAAPPSRVTLFTQAGLVELLQALLFAKQVGSNNQLHHPPLVVVLSCFDEIGKAKETNAWDDPAALLKKRLPLFSQFIESTWEENQVDVIGLSALGKALNDDVSDEAFMDDGPERQGWCICKGGKESDDLTLPVMTLMEKTGHEG